MRTPFVQSLTVLPFLLAVALGVVTMAATDVYAVNRDGMGHEHAQPWRSRLDGAVTRLSARISARMAAVVDSMRGHPLLASETGEIATEILTGGLSVMQEHRERLIRQAGDLRGANNTFETDDKRSAFDKIMVDVEALGVRIEDVERNDRLDALRRTTLPDSQRPSRTPTEEDRQAARAIHERAMGKYIRNARMDRLTDEEQIALERGGALDAETRDMATSAGADGGFVVAPDTRFYGSIVQALKFFGGMEAAGSEVITTDTGADLPIPTSDDTGNTGSIVGEAGSHASGTSPTVGQKVLHAYLYSSLIIKVSIQFLRDSSIDVESWLGARIGERLARIQNTHFTTGTGVGQPQGVMTASTQGRQAATGNSTSIPFDDVYRLIHSVDVAYRNNRCKFMMRDATALELRLAKDGNNRYLWPEMGSVQAGQPMTLAGYPVVINNDVAAMAASAKSVSFGDHFSYKIRRVSGIAVVRLNELYAANGQVGFLGFMRADGGLVDAGQGPVKHFANSAS